MKRSLFIILPAVLFSFYSCEKSTEADEYNSIWKPYTETSWKTSGSAADAFTPTNGGFSFIANIADTGAYSYTFVPSIYIVSNITSAKEGFLSFRGAITSAPDTLALVGGGIQTHTFGTLSGVVRTTGADSVPTSAKPFANNSRTTIQLSVNPDSCSREVQFTVNIAWNPYTGGATTNPLPKQKKITVEFFDIEMRINGIDVLSE